MDCVGRHMFFAMMMMLIPVLNLFHSGTASAREAAADTLSYRSDSSLVVTATRSAKALQDVAVPMEVVGAAEMDRRGQTRLDQALVALTGMALFEDHGTGIQMQGLSPDYTLILVDGEPVIGRNAGTLDLRRLSMRGLDRVEVVRGPTSSLYGSEALAGVVNLIPARAGQGFGGEVHARYGTHGSSEAGGAVSHGGERHDVRLRMERTASDGYDLRPEQFGLTSPAYIEHTADLRLGVDLGERWAFRLGARTAVQDQDGRFSIRTGPATERRYDEQAGRREWSVNPKWIGRMASGLKLTSSLYGSGYGTRVEHVSREDGSVLYADSFDQLYLKAEQQVTKLWNGRHLSVAGVGGVREGLGGDRYRSGEERPRSSLGYVYAQHEWIPGERLQIAVSGRFDAHSDYAARVSPKVSVLVRPGERFRVRGSIGTGFKAPAFRQLYLSFSNSIAGYSVFGSTLLAQGIGELRAQGQISQTFLDVDRLERIRAEHAVSYNVGFTVDSRGEARGAWSLRLDAFHNEVADLIETQPVAQKTNGQFVYGYFNLSEIYTRGVQAGLRWDGEVGRVMRVLLDGGYQFLQAHDRQVLRAIEAGTVFGRDGVGRDYRIGREDYSGLFGRSAHMATVSATLLGEGGAGGMRVEGRARVGTGNLREEGQARVGAGNLREEGWARVGTRSLTAQARWRSRYGYRDLDGNGFANLDREFVASHVLVGLTANQRIELEGPWSLQLQAGVDNLLGVTFPEQIPSLAGRRLHMSVNLLF